MRLPILLSMCIIAVTGLAQAPSPSLNIGDPVPPLRISEWVKGAPVEQFKKGNIYILEFWATWCVPCKAAMPHLSALARAYRDKVTIIGVDCYENNPRVLKKVKPFVDSMGTRMDYTVARGDSNFIYARWFEASGEARSGIPISFVVDAEGRLAWVGHPQGLEKVIAALVNNTWDIKNALVRRNLGKQLKELDDSLNYELMRYRDDEFTEGRRRGKPDSALLAIDAILKGEPRLKYAESIAYHTFASLLKTDPHKAYLYGKEALTASTYDEPPYGSIVRAVGWYSDKLNLTGEIYELGAEACQEEVDYNPFWDRGAVARAYKRMGEYYRRAGDKEKAEAADRKAGEVMKN
ncbi:MAG: TlpA family protein disulfide reductase [Bacteroidetes bacterium]|nr:TlpA family protein disulfide reductase [Bacteroidota bacterium]